eukprot:13574035-Ditylum_brightwellii.AAC.1
MTDEYFILLDHIGRVVQLVNENGGWTVVGLYKCGVIIDCTLVSNNNGTTGGNSNNSNDNVHVDN